MFEHRKNTDPRYWYIYEKLPFIPHRPEYGDKPKIWETEIIVDFNTPEFDKHGVFDDTLRSKTDQFLVTDIVYKPIYNDSDMFGKWLITMRKIEGGKLTEQHHHERYNSHGSLTVRFLKRIGCVKRTEMEEAFYATKL